MALPRAESQENVPSVWIVGRFLLKTGNKIMECGKLGNSEESVSVGEYVLAVRTSFS